MPKKVTQLSEVSIKRLRHKVDKYGKPSKTIHAVGGVAGLYLQCTPPAGSLDVGARSWIFRVMVGNKRRSIGLGGYPDVPTKNAREMARAIKNEIANGIDPIADGKERKAHILEKQAGEVTFKEIALKYITKRSSEYKTSKQTQRLISSFERLVYPYIGLMLIKDIERHHLIRMLENYYSDIPDTSIRVVGHIEKVFQLAIIEGIRTTHNPAKWTGNLSQIFPSKNKIAPIKHHEYLPWQKLPKFMKALDTLDKPIGAKPEASCLAFIIYTVARPSEGRLVEWKDIDLANKVWTVRPSAIKGDDRRKSHREWQVHLTPEAIKVLKSQPSYSRKAGLVFQTLANKAIPDGYFGTKINKPLGYEGDTHGFRTTHKTWCQVHGVVDEVSELALKHTQSDATRAAYARDQLFDARKKILTIYSKFAATGDSNMGEVVSIQKRRGQDNGYDL